MYSGRTAFRARPLRILWISVILVASMLGTYFTYGSDENWFVPWFFAGFAVLSLAALFETLTEFLVLDAHELRFRKSFRTVKIPKADISQVTWTKGDGASLKLVSGKWVMVPDMGYDSQGLTNSIRAWTKSR